MDVDALKARLSDVPGIETLTLTHVGGRDVYGFNGLIAGVDPSSTEDQVIVAIRNAAALRAEKVGGLGLAAVAGELNVAAPPPLPQPKATIMSKPASGGFAASLRAMMDEARAGVEKARSDGLAMVGEAVGKLNEAKDATKHVAGQMARTIEDEAAAVMSELGQISNDLTGEGN